MRPSSSASRPTGWSSWAARSRSECGGSGRLADRLQEEQRQRRPEKHPEDVEGDFRDDPKDRDELIECVALRGHMTRLRFGNEAHSAAIQRSGAEPAVLCGWRAD